MEVFRKTVEILIDQTEKSIITDEAFPRLLQTQVASSVHLYFKQSVCVKGANEIYVNCVKLYSGDRSGQLSGLVSSKL